MIDWVDRLNEQGSQDMPDMGPAATGGMPGQMPGATPSPGEPSVTNPPQEEPEAAGKKGEGEDQTQDPQAPDMEGIHDESADFETWRKEYFELAIKGDTNEMLDAIGQVRDRNLNAKQRRFVEDNLQCVLLRQDANFDKASKEIRKLINQELDRNNPAVSLMQHIMNTIQAYPILHNVFIKLAGQGALKSELHRQMIGALAGAVQTGSGPGSMKPDLIFPAKDYSIDISTRFYTTWGDIALGKWTLQEDDPERYLSDPELERLQEGSPEEKRVLRRRVCMESIADKFSGRCVLVHVVNPEDGMVHAFGWDIAESLRAGYKEGKLVVRKRQSQMRDAMIDDDGAIIPLFSYVFNYKRETGEVGAGGEAKPQNAPFLEQRDGTLYLTTEAEIIQELGGGMPGMMFESFPYRGNPSDIVTLMRCYPSSVEMLMRRC